MTTTKKFVLNLEIQEKNTPQTWIFENITRIEQLAVWMIVKECAEKQIHGMLNGSEQINAKVN